MLNTFVVVLPPPPLLGIRSYSATSLSVKSSLQTNDYMYIFIYGKVLSQSSLPLFDRNVFYRVC